MNPKRGNISLSLDLILALALAISCAKTHAAETPEWKKGIVSEAENQLDFREAQQLLTKGKWEDAAIVLKSLSRRDPRDVQVSLGLATALAYTHRREEALGVLTQAAQSERGSLHDVLVRRARVLSRTFFTNTTYQTYRDGLNQLQSEHYHAAVDAFLRALEQEPDNAEILTRLGQALVLDRDYDSAVERLKAAKRLNPFEPEIALWLGRAMHQRGELAAGVAELRLAYKALPQSERAPVWLADALVSTGDSAHAIELLDDDLERQPFHLQSLLMLARLRSQEGIHDRRSLATAQKDLRVGLSRVSKYASRETPGFEGELGCGYRRNDEALRAELNQLLDSIERRINS